MLKTLAPSIVTSRDPQGLKFMSIVEAAFNKTRLSEGEAAQRVNDTPGLAELIANFIAENRCANKFKDEEVSSGYGYLSGYKPKGLNEQCNQLRILFPGLGFPNQDLLAPIENSSIELSEYAEGWFAIPNWRRNTEFFGGTNSEAGRKGTV